MLSLKIIEPMDCDLKLSSNFFTVTHDDEHYHYSIQVTVILTTKRLKNQGTDIAKNI